ncbi:MAG: Uma2 family endonuclease [Prochloraceae cyanobacterium]
MVTAINKIGKTKKLALALPELRCTFSARSLVPDIAVFEWQNIPRDSHSKIANKFEIAPDWIIEILFPEQSANRVINKISFCLNHGTKLGWLIDCEDESVSIFKANTTPNVKERDDILPVLDVIKEWQLKVADIFAWLNI